MRAIHALAVAAVLIAAAASPSRGSEEWSFEAFQPIWNLGGTIRLSRVTILTYNSGDAGISAVLGTCDSSLVKTDYGPQQRNAAFAMGLRSEVQFNSDREPPLFGDTLRVVLRATGQPTVEGDFSLGLVAAATVQCILANAAKSPSISVVSIKAEGSPEIAGMSGNYRTVGFRAGPKQWEFSGDM